MILASRPPWSLRQLRVSPYFIGLVLLLATKTVVSASQRRHNTFHQTRSRPSRKSLLFQIPAITPTKSAKASFVSDTSRWKFHRCVSHGPALVHHQPPFLHGEITHSSCQKAFLPLGASFRNNNEDRKQENPKESGRLQEEEDSSSAPILSNWVLGVDRLVNLFLSSSTAVPTGFLLVWLLWAFIAGQTLQSFVSLLLYAGLERIRQLQDQELGYDDVYDAMATTEDDSPLGVLRLGFFVGSVALALLLVPSVSVVESTTVASNVVLSSPLLDIVAVGAAVWVLLGLTSNGPSTATLGGYKRESDESQENRPLSPLEKRWDDEFQSWMQENEVNTMNDDERKGK